MMKHKNTSVIMKVHVRGDTIRMKETHA